MSIHPEARRHLLRKLLIFIVLIAVVASLVWWRNDQPVSKPQPVTATSSSSVPTVPTSFNKKQYSINDPASIWVVVNKGRILPSDYAPSLVVPNVPLNYPSSSNDSHLRTETARALELMFAAAKKNGFDLKLFSGYRSYSEQMSVYNNFVSTEGQAHADISSARPGHSEHQTGLAADVSVIGASCELQLCFGNTPAGRWVAANAYKYGFLVRYQNGKENLTGYEYEPWHLRYAGGDLAAEINKTGQTLEQFFGLTTYTDYSTTSYQLKSGY